MSLDQYLAPTRAEAARMRRQEDRTFAAVMVIVGFVLLVLLSTGIVRTIRVNQYCGDPANWTTQQCILYMTNSDTPPPDDGF